MSEKRRELLWEYTWYQPAPADLPEFGYTRTFRVVGWRFEYEDWKLGALHYEELYEDAMGAPTWQSLGDDAVPHPVIGKLLQMAGVIPADEDLSCL